MKSEKIKNGMIAYTIIGLIAAVFYYVNLSTILNSSYVFLSLQAMVWHDIVIIIGVYSIVKIRAYEKKGRTFFIQGYMFWLVLAFLAMILDIILSKVIPEAGTNFFYLSPIQESVTYPVLIILFKKPSPYTVFVLAFIVYYTLGVVALYGLLRGIGVYKERKTNNK